MVPNRVVTIGAETWSCMSCYVNSTDIRSWCCGLKGHFTHMYSTLHMFSYFVMKQSHVEYYMWLKCTIFPLQSQWHNFELFPYFSEIHLQDKQNNGLQFSNDILPLSFECFCYWTFQCLLIEDSAFKTSNRGHKKYGIIVIRLRLIRNNWNKTAYYFILGIRNYGKFNVLDTCTSGMKHRNGSLNRVTNLQFLLTSWYRLKLKEK